jgi:hypothetical protein
VTEHKVGPVEAAVEEDLAGLNLRSGQATLAAMARKLARTIDARGDDEAASALAKAVDTLRQVLNQLMAKEVNSPDDARRLEQLLGAVDFGSSALSPPLRYPPDTGKANRRTGNRPGGKRAGSD